MATNAQKTSNSVFNRKHQEPQNLTNSRSLYHTAYLKLSFLEQSWTRNSDGYFKERRRIRGKVSTVSEITSRKHGDYLGSTSNTSLHPRRANHPLLLYSLGISHKNQAKKKFVEVFRDKIQHLNEKSFQDGRRPNDFL